ncbi:MAG: TIGR02757 family protein [Bacteroidota bacterium]|nr:TIGR02757 family protein [Bacteroidota bacterium]
MNDKELRGFLEEKVSQYNRPSFIESDPVSIPHHFSRKEDIEIAGFLAATIAWGQRPVIIRNANLLMERMDLSPYEFVISASAKELKNLETFVHRTFNGMDAKFFVLALRNIYKKHGGLENVFVEGINVSFKATKAQSILEDSPIQNAIIHFRETFISIRHDTRSDKHISNPGTNSSAKRINMYLRWMVRQDNAGVDFGIWKSISPALLQIPLDVHVGNVGRELGLLERKQSDWKAVEELTAKLRKFDEKDPVKYDFALFGLGIFEGFKK